MKIIDKYIYKELVLPTIFGISIFTFIFLIDILVEMMENILVKDIPVLDVLEMISFYLPPIMVQTIPMGILLGVMITYGNLSSNSELIALESIGIGIKQFLKPALIIGIITTMFLFFLEETVIPNSYDKLARITKKIAYTKPALKIDEKIFIEDIGDYNIYINEMNNDGSRAENLVIFKKENDSQYPQVIVSKVAKWEKNNMILEDANFYQINSDGEKKLSGSFNRQLIPIQSFFGDYTSNGSTKKSMMGITDLKKELKVDHKKDVLKSYEIELHKKINIPLAAVIFSFLGVMLSVKKGRTGKGMSFGVSLVIIFLYIMGLDFGQIMAKKEIFPTAIALSIPNILLTILSLILFYKQTRTR
ncbi:MAG: LptF/LptG family permease [Fusobacteriota bacterium]